jgi:hypothetical protein
LRGGSNRTVNPKALPCNCLTSETEVVTEAGPKAIGEIAVGDMVWAQDVNTGLRTPARVSGLFSRIAKNLIVITVGAATIHATPEHPFWLPGEGWVLAESLHVGDELSTLDGEVLTVDALEYRTGEWRVHNFEVEGLHSYFVSPQKVLVHNCDLPGGSAPDPKAYKAKIQGNAQKTGTEGHRFRSLREAITEAKKVEVTEVHLDHGYNRGLGLPPKTIASNRRPDVLSVYNDKSVMRVEVQSFTDNPAVLRGRNTALDAQLTANGYKPLPPKVVKPTKNTGK